MTKDMDDKATGITGTGWTAVLGMGTLIGIGAGLGLIIATLLGNPALGLSVGAGLGTVAGAVVESRRQQRPR